MSLDEFDGNFVAWTNQAISDLCSAREQLRELTARPPREGVRVTRVEGRQLRIMLHVITKELLVVERLESVTQPAPQPRWSGGWDDGEAAVETLRSMTKQLMVEWSSGGRTGGKRRVLMRDALRRITLGLVRSEIIESVEALARRPSRSGAARAAGVAREGEGARSRDPKSQTPIGRAARSRVRDRAPLRDRDVRTEAEASSSRTKREGEGENEGALPREPVSRAYVAGEGEGETDDLGVDLDVVVGEDDDGGWND